MAKKKEETVSLAELGYTNEELDSMDEATDIVDIDIEEKSVPTMGDPEWNDYVMTQFTDEELFDGAPTVDGLRRVVTKLLGDITTVNVYMAQVPVFGIGQNNRATAVVTVTVETEDKTLSYSDAADADPSSTDGEFMKFPSALAVTRAEARALRKMLKIRKPAAEELAPSNSSSSENVFSEITDTQIKAVSVLSSRAGVDIDKFIAQGKRKLKNIKEASYGEAVAMLGLLNDYINGSKQVPDSIKKG